ncbi:MAG: Ku protein [Stellaceae bacterium]
MRGDALAEPPSPSRVALHPHDPHTGEEIEREEVVKGNEYERGRFVTFTADELKALDVESSKNIDLETFVPRAEVDLVYFSTPYYVYPAALSRLKLSASSVRQWPTPGKSAIARFRVEGGVDAWLCKLSGLELAR